MPDIGITAELAYETGSTFTAIPNCKMISVPNITTNVVDTTNLDHSDYWKRFIPGTMDPGVITFEAEFDSTVYSTLFGMLRETVGWRVTAPDSETTVVTADGFLTKVEVSYETENQVMLKGEVKITGGITLS